jgi:ribosome biogenesis GTPase
VRLSQLGWDDEWQRAFTPWADAADTVPARVAIEFNYIYRLYTPDAEIEATTTGKLRHEASSRIEMPAVGDWVAVRQRSGEGRATIVGLLPRRSRFSRKAAGNVTDEQIVAANVDVVFIVMGLDGDYNLRRLERYLLLARESNAAPVVLLTKPDLAADISQQTVDAVGTSGDVPVHVVSPRLGTGLEQVSASLTPGRTAALLGSSGVGKSTIINRLAGGEIQKTREVRATDSRGRHTTTHRELVVLPDGGLIIDTPGMRELQLWDAAESVHDTFDDIAAIGAHCHFTNCRHDNEPRCAVQAAVAEGVLPVTRLQGYLKLQQELAKLASLRRGGNRRDRVSE